MDRRSLLALFLIALVIILMPYYFQVISPIPTVSHLMSGCTDPSASNYNSSATEDDGSCCVDNCVTFTLDDQYNDGFEGSITFDGSVMTAVSGQAPASFVFCLEDGDYSYHYSCSNYCSEHSWTVTDNEGTVLSQGSGSAGSEQDITFSVGAPPAVFGCTASDACNYDPDATDDDGSCSFPGDSCPVDESCTLYATADSNAATGATQFFSYTTTMDGYLTVSSDGSPEDTYLGLLGSCGTDSNGVFLDLLCTSDDIDGNAGNYASECTIEIVSGQEVIINWNDAYSPSSFTFSVTENPAGCEDDVFEENDSHNNPVPITAGSYDLQMCAGDEDWFSITVNNGEKLKILIN